MKFQKINHKRGIIPAKNYFSQFKKIELGAPFSCEEKTEDPRNFTPSWAWPENRKKADKNK